MYLHSECIIQRFVNTLCSHPTTQEGVEDLLVASTVVVSETPEGKVGLGGKCDEESDCDGDLTCDPGTKTCTEVSLHSF